LPVDSSLVIGVDFGGTAIKAGFVQGGRILRAAEEPTPQTGRADDVLDAIARAVKALDPAPASVGVAIPGEVDSDGRCWGLPNVAGFKGVNLGVGLSERLGCPVAVENDATTAALGEYLCGHGTRFPSFLMVTLGTGVGGGLVLGGQLYPGANGFAGEIGHINVDRTENAPQCGCGKRGCLETYTGTAALKRMFVTFGGREVSEIKEIADAARRGNVAALDTFSAMGEWLGRGLAMIQNTLDLNALIFTGGIARSFDLIEPSVRAALREGCAAEPLAEVPLVVSELGAHAGVIGAAHLPQLGG
jgi:glucokinase